MPPTAPPRGLRLLDLSALVVGYGMAALLFRALWRSHHAPTTVEALFLMVEYLWLGLAMSGPLVLLIDRRAAPGHDQPGRYTWAELAWLLIGGYWLGLTVLVAPSRLPINPLLSLFPVLAALGLRLFGARRPARTEDDPPSWTHAVAVGLLVTWPGAWAVLVALSPSVL